MSKHDREREALSLAPRSVDMVRVIRRSIRCFRFGLFGLAPFIGPGFGAQALRLRQSVSADLADGWRPPPVYAYWLFGALAMMAATAWCGLLLDLSLCVLLLGLQSWHCWRSFVRRPRPAWNPAERELLVGTVCAYAGLAVSLWAVVVLVLEVVKAIQVV